jgi:2-keto-4-pentenoate hydratase/2-oxohepta-3-ene-1,7-dioic acid hydratase in catechol pathway
MRIARYRSGQRTGLGIQTSDGTILPADADDLMVALRTHRVPQPVPGAAPVTGAQLLAPLPRPGKILCCGVNYASHQQENPAAVLPDEPFFFAKLPSAVIGPGEPVILPEARTELDYEVELAVVIGRQSNGLSEAEALDAVFGYTVLNDISARDVQFRDNQITLGKGADTFCPLGPVIVTADEVPDPQALTVSSSVNGQLRQHESTAGMIFPVARLLAFLSRHITLEPGDVVSTGTPAGVGCFMDPPGLLRPGDQVEVRVDRVGALANPVLGPQPPGAGDPAHASTAPSGAGTPAG